MRKLIIFLLSNIFISGILFAGSITITFPNGGENLELNSYKFIKWNTTGLTNTLKITLWQNGQRLGVIAQGLHPSLSKYNWKVGTFQGGVAVPGSGFKIKIKEKSTTISGISANNFFIHAAIPQKPDLVINGKMTRTPKHPGEGEKFKFKFCVANSGRGMANDSVAELIATGPNGFYRRKEINIKQFAGGVGDHQYISKDFTLWNMGIYRFKVKLDIRNTVDEADEGNNEKFILIGVNPRPDLVVCLDQNQRVQMTTGKLSVHAYVKNIGSFKSKPSVLRFYIQQKGSKNFEIPSLEPGKEFKVTRRHGWLTKGHKKVVAHIDYTDNVKERDENNNKVESSIYVRLPHEDKYALQLPKKCSNSNMFMRVKKR